MYFSLSTRFSGLHTLKCIVTGLPEEPVVCVQFSGQRTASAPVSPRARVARSGSVDEAGGRASGTLTPNWLVAIVSISTGTIRRTSEIRHAAKSKAGWGTLV